MENKESVTIALKKLREAFPDEAISVLPKPYKRDSPKGKCKECGGYHGLPAVHLKYVGHAALTQRLLMVDPFWSWEPMGKTPEGTPLIDKDGGMWIYLTICGVTRIGYGDAQGKTGGDAMKERIGDALRNAAMRFGCALDLWHKGDLPPDDMQEEEQSDQQEEKPRNSRENPDDKYMLNEDEEKVMSWLDNLVNGTLDNFRVEMDKYERKAVTRLRDHARKEYSTKRQQIEDLLIEKETGGKN